jgi:hypothetical protein
MQGIGRQLTLAIDPQSPRWFRDFSRTLMPSLNAVADQTRKLTLAGAQLGTAVVKAAERGWPPNWGEPHFRVWKPAVLCIRDEHLPLVWTPQRELALRLVGLPTSTARLQLLVTRRRSVANECDRLADELESPRLVSVRDSLPEVATELRAGRYRGAQALSAAILTELAEGTFEYGRLSDARASFDLGDPLKIGIGNFRTALALLPAAMALRNRNEPRSGYNRHLTLHGVSSQQYTPEHAVLAAMIAASVAREAQQLITAKRLVKADN